MWPGCLCRVLELSFAARDETTSRIGQATAVRALSRKASHDCHRKDSKFASRSRGIIFSGGRGGGVARMFTFVLGCLKADWVCHKPLIS